MAQIFSRRSNSLARFTIAAAILLTCAGGWAMNAIFWAPYTTWVRIPLDQPVPFSHKHHVTDDGIDCRYCHTSVEQSSYAGLPSTETCMTCHSEIFKDAP